MRRKGHSMLRGLLALCHTATGVREALTVTATASATVFATAFISASVFALGQTKSNETSVPVLISKVREAAEAMEAPRLQNQSRPNLPTAKTDVAESRPSVGLQAKSLTGSLEQSALTLGALAGDLRNKRIESARDLLGRVRPQTLPAEWQGIYALLAAQVARNSQMPSTALTYVEMAGHSSRQSFEFEERIARESFVDAVNAKLYQQALGTLVQYRTYFDRDFLPRDVEIAMLTLAGTVHDSGNSALAKDLFRRLVKNYPIGEGARQAHNRFSELYCKTPDALNSQAFQNSDAPADELWGNSEKKRIHAREIIRRVGPLPDVREFALALSGLSLTALVPKKPVDTLALPAKADLLESAEFLLSLREHELALQLTEYLKNAKTFGLGFERDRVLFFYARTLNSTQKPEQAAANYKAVFSQFPRSSFAKQARQRYLLSLHYARKFKEVAAESKALYPKSMRTRESLWRTFWSEYLAGDNQGAVADAASLTDPDDRVRAQYWMARILERTGKTAEAKKAYGILQEKSAHTHYAVLARWRLALNEQKKDAATVQFAARPSLSSAALSFEKFGNKISLDVPEEYKPLRFIVDAGLGEFAREKIGTQFRKERRPENLLALSRLAFYAGDFKNASLVPRRNFKAVSSIPRLSADLNTALSENRELWQLSFPAAYAPILEEATREIDVNAYLVLAVMRAESNYDPQALSNVGARGLMQIMPLTGHKIARLVGYEQFEPHELHKPDINIAFGAWYLKRLSNYYKGNTVLAIAAYNAGPEAVDRWIAQNSEMELDEFIENIPYDQTRNYVGKVLLNMEMYSRLYSNRGQGLELKLGNKLPKPVLGMEMF